MEVKQKKPKDKKYNNTPEYNKKYYADHKVAILKTLQGVAFNKDRFENFKN